MSSLSKQEQLRSLLDEQQERMCQTFPAQRYLAVVALIRARDWRYLALHNTLHTPAWNAPSPIFYLCTSGWQKALQLCFGDATASLAVASEVNDSTLNAWAEQVLQECDRLAAGEQVLAYCETGFMRMQQGGQQDFLVWIASKNMPTEWREREDLAWWANALAQTHMSEIQELAAENVSIQQQLVTFAREWRADTNIYSTTRAIDDYYHRLGMLWVKCMACHLQYPAETVISGCAIDLYRDVLAVLIGWTLKHLDLCCALVAKQPFSTLRALLAPAQDADALIEALSETLGVERSAIERVVNAFCLDQKNVSWHCSVAGVPAPPLLRVNDRQLVWSLAGLLGEPFLFLTRELKRRDSYEYHTASHAHEEVFRQDLYSLFSDKRFVKSAGSVVLKGVQGDLTTDVDALIFDRKTGALALFELKSQDPFAYSRQERIRQRDYFHRAGKQVLACVQWLNRSGANALLTRLDFKLVKRLKVQKTYIFVLGRYLAHFFDGPEFDRRAIWGTWPQVLRLVNGVSFGAEDANPILGLYNKLLKDTPLAPTEPLVEVQEILIGESRVYVYLDFQTYKRRVGEMGGVG